MRHGDVVAIGDANLSAASAGRRVLAVAGAGYSDALEAMNRAPEPLAYFAAMRRPFAAGFGLVFGATLAATVDARLTFGAAAGLAAGDLRVLAAAA